MDSYYVFSKEKGWSHQGGGGILENLAVVVCMMNSFLFRLRLGLGLGLGLGTNTFLDSTELQKLSNTRIIY